MDPEKLKAMIEEDEFDLLRVPEKPPALTGEDRLRDGFQEILEFVAAHGKEPEADVTDMAQATLAWRLQGIRGDAQQIAQLADMDSAGLLTISEEPPASLDDLFASDDLGLLDGDDASEILDTSALPELQQPDERAEGKRVEGFEEFEPRFIEVHRQLKVGERKLVVFRTRGEQPRVGDFFVLRGVLCLVDQVDSETLDRHGRRNGRMRVIFENGTESNYLLRAFTRKLYQAGKRVTEPSGSSPATIELGSDTELGYVYVLRSKSDDPQVTSIPFLHKIGFTKRSVADRLGKAEDAITFLKSPVEVVAEYQMPAVAAQKVEHLLHKLFADVRVDASFQRSGVPVGDATEWFSVPRAVIDQAITLIESGSISNYVYDAKTCKLVLA